MRSTLIDILACPKCRSAERLRITAEKEVDDDVIEGSLICPSCNAEFAIRGGVPRFVAAGEDYCANFGFQWREWKETQIDRLAGHRLSTGRFFYDTGWDPSWLNGKLVLDAGCGAGRFADVAAAHGARVIACDISDAVDACREVTAVHGDKVECVQASLFDLPLREGSFDAVYCIGVIQHTPDPEAVITGLPRFLKPAGRLAYNFYEEGLWRRLQIVKYALRLVTPHLPVPWTLALSKSLVAVFFPLTRFLSPIRKVRILNHFIPIAAVHEPTLNRDQQYAWTLLDTFDWYGARYEKRQNHARVAETLRDKGLLDVKSRPGIVTATANSPGDRKA